MKKICLAFVLSIVTVFSISAQTTDKSTEKTAAATETVTVKVDAAGNVVESPGAEGKISPAESPAAEKKPEIAVMNESKDETVKPEITEPVKKPAPEETMPPSSETVKPTALTETDRKTEVREPVKKPAEAVLQAKTYSLGALSTGNATVDGYIEEFSELYDVDPLLIYAQMSQESSFRARATSLKGASGFMQLMPDTARRFGVTNIYNPKQNIKAGVKYMRFLLDKFGGDVRLALAGYNAGEGSVMKYGNRIPPYRETQNYVAKILNHYQLLADQTANLAQNEEAANK